jgi:hypothetical protein
MGEEGIKEMRGIKDPVYFPAGRIHLLSSNPIIYLLNRRESFISSSPVKGAFAECLVSPARFIPTACRNGTRYFLDTRARLRAFFPSYDAPC